MRGFEEHFSDSNRSLRRLWIWGQCKSLYYNTWLDGDEQFRQAFWGKKRDRLWIGRSWGFDCDLHEQVFKKQVCRRAACKRQDNGRDKKGDARHGCRRNSEKKSR